MDRQSKSITVLLSKYRDKVRAGRSRASWLTNQIVLGELRITVPSFEDKAPTFYPVNKIPKGSPKDISSRCEALQGLLASLKAKTSKSFSEHKASMEDEDDNVFSNIINRQPANDNGKLLQIRISYVLEKKKGPPPAAGYIFQRPKHVGDENSSSHEYESIHQKAVCAYSLSGAKPERCLDEIDGVRCWLPCIDHLEQRAVFDITIHAPRDRDLVLCSGKRLSMSNRLIEHMKLRKLLETVDDVESLMFHEDFPRDEVSSPPIYGTDEKIPYTSTRFFSATRIPAKVVGFFVGSAESYQMPLYRCRGHIYFAHDIVDNYRDSIVTTSQFNRSVDPEMIRLSNMASSMELDTGSKSVDIRAKRRKVSFSHQVEGISQRDDGSTAKQFQAPFYEQLIRHSLLGFDLALRFIHKMLGRRYHYDFFAIVYIPDLAFDFVSYDGFVFINAKHLHDQHLVYAETPHHLVCIRAYLYGYISAAFPVSGYFQQYLIHGIVGYTFHLYVRSIYGEDESSFHLFKIVESVVSLSKLYPSTIIRPIASISLPEAFEQYLPWCQAYLVHRSVVLFHIIESRVGGSEPIRQAIQQLLKAPENKSHNQEFVQPGQSLYLENDQARNTSHYDTVIMHQSMVTKGESSPHPDVTTGWQDQLGSMASPQLFPQSPGIHLPISSDYGSDSVYSPNAIGTPSLQRQFSLSMPAETGQAGVNIPFPESLTSDCVTGESFVQLLRVITGAANDLDEFFLDQFVYRNVNIRGKFDVRLDPKVEGKPRNFHITLDPIYEANEAVDLLSSSNMQVNLKIRICETREERMSEASFIYGGKLSRRGRSPSQQPESNLLIHTQALFSRPGRRGGSRKTGSTASDDAAMLTINRTEGSVKMAADMQRRSVTVRLLYYFHHNPKLFDIDVFSSNAKSRRTALQSARDSSHPLRYILADPLMNQLNIDINISAFPDPLLVEQLFLELDAYDILRQSRALRSLATSPVMIASSTTTTDKSLALQFHAFADCLQGIQPLPPTAMMIAKGEAAPDPNAPPTPVHSIFVRVEAAFNLLEWQMNRLPPSSAPHLSSSLFQKDGRWEGALLLMKMLCDVFVDTMTGQLLPIEQGADEWKTYLRGGLITVVSFLKTHRGITPIEVAEFLLMLAKVMNNATTNSLSNHYLHATYLLALSRVTLDASPEESKINEEIVSHAKSTLRSVFVNARLEVLVSTSSRQILPTHHSGGMLAAAALNCLGQIDRRAYLSMNAETFTPHCFLSTIGIISKVDYAQFFLPEGRTLNNASKKKEQHDDYLIRNFHSSLNTPLLRMVALECFLSICFNAFSALVTATQQQQLQQQLSFASAAAPAKPSNLLRTPDNNFLPLALEAMLVVIRHDPDPTVRQQAALTWWNVLIDQPPLIALKGLSLGNFSSSLFVDPSALTYRDPYLQLLRSRGISSKVSSNVRSCLRSKQQGLRRELRQWWKHIVHIDGNDQMTRSLLLMSWLFVFQDKAPRSISELPSASPGLLRSAQTARDQAEETTMYEKLIEQMNIPSPATIIEPLESFARVEMKLRVGSAFVMPAMRSQQPVARPLATPPAPRPTKPSQGPPPSSSQRTATRPIEPIVAASLPSPSLSSKEFQSDVRPAPSSTNVLQLKIPTKTVALVTSNDPTQSSASATTVSSTATSAREESISSPIKLSLKLSLKRSSSESSTT